MALNTKVKDKSHVMRLLVYIRKYGLITSTCKITNLSCLTILLTVKIALCGFQCSIETDLDQTQIINHKPLILYLMSHAVYQYILQMYCKETFIYYMSLLDDLRLNCYFALSTRMMMLCILHITIDVVLLT